MEIPLKTDSLFYNKNHPNYIKITTNNFLMKLQNLHHKFIGYNDPMRRNLIDSNLNPSID